mmetsp:Transcript_25301/g.68738  ORF Transcript_25301/g.68738 Transcript_25301/m.68738 type:complete len:243 (+) Transcript_25301:526-1254(+)
MAWQLEKIPPGAHNSTAAQLWQRICSAFAHAHVLRGDPGCQALQRAARGCRGFLLSPLLCRQLLLLPLLRTGKLLLHLCLPFCFPLLSSCQRRHLFHLPPVCFLQNAHLFFRLFLLSLLQRSQCCSCGFQPCTIAVGGERQGRGVDGHLKARGLTSCALGPSHGVGVGLAKSVLAKRGQALAEEFRDRDLAWLTGQHDCGPLLQGLVPHPALQLLQLGQQARRISLQCCQLRLQSLRLVGLP